MDNNNINEDIKSSKMKKFEIITNNINNIYDDYDDSLRDEVKRRKQSNYTFYESKSNKKINTDPNNIDIEKNCYPINKYLSASIKNENIINNCYTNQNKNNSTLGSNFNFDKKSSKDHLDGRNYNNHSTVFISNKSKPLIKSNYNNHLGIIESNNENNNLKNDFRQSTHSHNNNFVCNIINTEISEIPEDNNYYHLNVKSYNNNNSDIIDYSKGENINNKEKKLKKKEKIKSKELIENRGKGFYKGSKNRNIASTGIIKINQKENKFKTSENNNREININKDKFFSNSEKKQILEDFLKSINSSSISKNKDKESIVNKNNNSESTKDINKLKINLVNSRSHKNIYFNNREIKIYKKKNISNHKIFKNKIFDNKKEEIKDKETNKIKIINNNKKLKNNFNIMGREEKEMFCNKFNKINENKIKNERKKNIKINNYNKYINNSNKKNNSIKLKNNIKIDNRRHKNHLTSINISRKINKYISLKNKTIEDINNNLKSLKSIHKSLFKNNDINNNNNNSNNSINNKDNIIEMKKNVNINNKKYFIINDKNRSLDLSNDNQIKNLFKENMDKSNSFNNLNFKIINKYINNKEVKNKNLNNKKKYLRNNDIRKNINKSEDISKNINYIYSNSKDTENNIDAINTTREIIKELNENETNNIQINSYESQIFSNINGANSITYSYFNKSDIRLNRISLDMPINIDLEKINTEESNKDEKDKNKSHINSTDNKNKYGIIKIDIQPSISLSHKSYKTPKCQKLENFINKLNNEYEEEKLIIKNGKIVYYNGDNASYGNTISKIKLYNDNNNSNYINSNNSNSYIKRGTLINDCIENKISNNEDKNIDKEDSKIYNFEIESKENENKDKVNNISIINFYEEDVDIGKNDINYNNNESCNKKSINLIDINIDPPHQDEDFIYNLELIQKKNYKSMLNEDKKIEELNINNNIKSKNTICSSNVVKEIETEYEFNLSQEKFYKPLNKYENIFDLEKINRFNS